MPSCGYDAGDCGTEQWETLYSLKPRPNHTYSIPLGTTAMFFNLSSYFSNGTVLSAEHSPCPAVRTAVLAQTFKTLSLTFSKNTSRSYSCITINGTSGSGAVVTVSAGGGAGAVYSVSIACGLCVCWGRGWGRGWGCVFCFNCMWSVCVLGEGLGEGLGLCILFQLHVVCVCVQISFNVSVDTATPNLTLVKDHTHTLWSFPQFNSTHSDKVRSCDCHVTVM